MKNLYLLGIAILLTSLGSLYGQTLHNVDVTSSNTFEPSELTITAGDTVVWTNSGGTHNVNGTQNQFPDNPDSFGNEVGSAGWTYQFVFTVIGEYDYQCDVHAAIMQGTITVEDDPLSVKDNSSSKEFLSIFPNPVVNQISWKWNDINAPTNAALFLYDSTGKRVDSFLLNGAYSHDLSNLSIGLYTYVISQNENLIQTGKLLIQR